MNFSYIVFSKRVILEKQNACDVLSLLIMFGDWNDGDVVLRIWTDFIWGGVFGKLYDFLLKYSSRSDARTDFFNDDTISLRVLPLVDGKFCELCILFNSSWILTIRFTIYHKCFSIK